MTDRSLVRAHDHEQPPIADDVVAPPSDARKWALEEESRLPDGPGARIHVHGHELAPSPVDEPVAWPAPAGLLAVVGRDLAPSAVERNASEDDPSIAPHPGEREPPAIRREAHPGSPCAE